jgi:hypothetical protein
MKSYGCKDKHGCIFMGIKPFRDTSPVIKEEGKCGVRIKNKNKEQEHEQAY